MIEFAGALNPARSDITGTPATGQGYLVRPASGTGPGVLLLHAWWGLNDTFRAWAGELGARGYTVLAPDMFGGRIARTPDEAEALVTGIESDEKQQVALEQVVLGAADRLAEEVIGPIGVVGFSFGAAYGLWLSRKRPDGIAALVLFYGTGGPAGEGNARVLGHYAQNDPFEAAEDVDALEQELRDAARLEAFHRYPGTGHWFAEPDRPEHDAAAARLAWQRTHDFLERMLRQ